MLLLLEAPPRDVELVRTLVAAVAVPEVPVPVPVVVKAIAVERPFRGRAQPQIVVDLRQILLVVGRLVRGGGDGERVLFSGRHRAIRVLADRGPRFVAQPARHVDLAETAFVDEPDRVAHGRPAPIHRADLHDPVVARRRLDHPAAFPHGMRRGLLDVHVLASLQRPDRGERVPVIRRGNHDGVDVPVVEHPAQVLDEAGPEGVNLLQSRVVDPLGREVRVDIAERLDLDVFQSGEPALERVALSADPDAGGDHAIVRAENAAADVGRRLGARTEKLAAGGDTHRRRPDPGGELAP